MVHMNTTDVNVANINLDNSCPCQLEMLQRKKKTRWLYTNLRQAAKRQIKTSDFHSVENLFNPNEIPYTTLRFMYYFGQFCNVVLNSPKRHPKSPYPMHTLHMPHL